MKLKLDFIDVFVDVCATLVGRIVITVIAISIGGSIGVTVASGDVAGIFDALIIVFPLLLASIFHGVGLLVIPLLFGFTMLFIKFELRMRYLLIPALITFFALYSVTNTLIERERRMNERIFGVEE